MREYLKLLQDVVTLGEDKEDSTGVGTRSIHGEKLSFYAYKSLPLLTTRKMYPKGMIGELSAFLKGSTSLREFKEYGCNYWDKNVKNWNHPRADGDYTGPIYGAIWRNYNGVDQLREVVNQLKTEQKIKRRLLVSAWKVDELNNMCLPPCPFAFQFLVYKSVYLDIIVYQRSVDCFLGLPSDMVVYTLLLHIVANETMLVPRKVTFLMGDTHIYANHRKQVDELLRREPFPVPRLDLDSRATIDNFEPKMVKIINYQYHAPLKGELNV